MWLRTMSPKKYRPFPQYMPDDLQPVWIVRFYRGGDPIPAIFHADSLSFDCNPAVASFIDWFFVVEWRPRSV